MGIKIIGLDLDGTTLNREGTVSEYNREIIEKAINEGIEVVISTGRAFSAVNAEIKQIKGLKYIITSNGAFVIDVKDGSALYSRYLDPGAVIEVISKGKQYELIMEAFNEGEAYMSEKYYSYVKKRGSSYRNTEYVLKTRKPLENLYEFMYKNRYKIENINIIFTDISEKEKLRDHIEGIENATITSSFPNNFEVGGKNTSKKEALKFIMSSLNLTSENLMCFGDAPNDISMLEFASIGVAMDNASNETKAAADYITCSNNDDGVGKAIKKLVLDKEKNNYK